MASEAAFLVFETRMLCVAAGAAILSCAVALAPAPARPQASLDSRIDRIFSAVTSPKDPGLAVLVRKEGRAVFERGYGLRDLRSGLPIDAHTNFRLASDTKQFTAMAVMLLVHDGKLRYDEPLTEIFPKFPAYGRRITIRNLLNHTSGLVDYEDVMAPQYAGLSWEQIPQIHDAGVLALMEQQTSTQFPPGTNWKYSNSGYCVLAMAVEKVSGMPFAEFLRRRIFEPLGMRNTVAYVYGKNQVTNRAYGYTHDAGVWLETDQSPTSATLGDGGVYSSLGDLAKWDDALRNHTLLSAREMRPANTPVVLLAGAKLQVTEPDGSPAAYGFGWFLNPYRGRARMWHYGESIGFRSAIERFTKDNQTIIVLQNRSDLDPAKLALKVADVFFYQVTGQRQKQIRRYGRNDRLGCLSSLAADDHQGCVLVAAMRPRRPFTMRQSSSKYCSSSRRRNRRQRAIRTMTPSDVTITRSMNAPATVFQDSQRPMVCITG
jgi:CubicO group peptidase (beta-lactamase class C family)